MGRKVVILNRSTKESITEKQHLKKNYMKVISEQRRKQVQRPHDWRVPAYSKNFKEVSLARAGWVREKVVDDVRCIRWCHLSVLLYPTHLLVLSTRFLIMQKLFIHMAHFLYLNIIFFTAQFCLVYHWYPSRLYLHSFDTIDMLNQYFFNKINGINFDFKKEVFHFEHI